MRKIVERQLLLQPALPDHWNLRELAEMSKVLDTNPHAAERMMEKQWDQLGQPAEQAAFDGGFATKDNLAALKAMGIEDVMFSKRVGLAISDMVKNSWIYKRLRNFRAGIEDAFRFSNGRLA